VGVQSRTGTVPSLASTGIEASNSERQEPAQAKREDRQWLGHVTIRMFETWTHSTGQWQSDI
jgi:hypothetical protein